MDMNPEVFITARHEVEMALLRDYDVAAQELPYAITLSGPINLTVKELKNHTLLTWELADAAIMAWARGLPDDEFHELKATCFFEGGHAMVPVSVTRANARGFSLMNAFFEMVLDRASPAKM